jgi:lysozyme family protein
MAPSTVARPRGPTSSPASDEAAPFADDPEWRRSAYKQGVNPRTWHRAKPAAQALTDQYRRTGFVPALDRHFVGPDNRVYFRSPDTEPDQEARDRLVRETQTALLGAGSPIENATGIPEGGFKRAKEVGAGSATDTGSIDQSEPQSSRNSTLEHSSPTDRIDVFIKEMLDFEGAASNRSPDEDPGGPTHYGITHKTYRDWRLRYAQPDEMPPRGIPEKFSQVDRAAAARILREVAYHDRMLDRVEDNRLAHQLMDIFANTSLEGSFPFIQAAIDEVMRKNHLYNRHVKPIGLDQQVGKRTIERMNWLVRSGYGSELKNALVEHRLAAARQRPHYKYNPGWEKRFRRFLEPPHDL